MPSRTVSARTSETMEEPRAGAGASRKGAPFPPPPGQGEPAPPRAARNVTPHGKRVRVGVADPEHRSQEREEPGQEIPREPLESPAGADSPSPQGQDVLLRLAQREREEAGGEPGALGQEKEHTRPRGRSLPHEPARDRPQRRPCRPSKKVEEGQE